MATATSLHKRDGANSYSLYVFVIIVGCIATVLIGSGIYQMYHGDDEENAYDIPLEQRRYMREVRQRNLNTTALVCNRPDMVIPIAELNY
jgi:hypothetical protein